MISWLINSILLSLGAALIYFTLGRRLNNPVHRRSLLWLGLVLSLTLSIPLQIFEAPVEEDLHAELHHADNAHFNVVGVPETVEEYCHCQEPESSDQIMFTAVRGFDFIIQNRKPVAIVFLSFTVLILLLLAVRVTRLFLWTSRRPGFTELIGGKRVRFIDADGKIPAGSFRFFRPNLIWDSKLETLNEKEQGAILAHEFSHLKQLNTWENIFLAVLHSIWFLNPAFYLFRRELRLLSEYIADDSGAKVMGDRMAYAELILSLRSLGFNQLVYGFGGNTITSRIRRLAGQEESRKIRFVPVVGLLLVMMFGMSACTSPVLQTQEHELAVYEYMRDQHLATGQSSFCKPCTMNYLEEGFATASR